jgi:hypothetical protein
MHFSDKIPFFSMENMSEDGLVEDSVCFEKVHKNFGIGLLRFTGYYKIYKRIEK